MLFYSNDENSNNDANELVLEEKPKRTWQKRRTKQADREHCMLESEQRTTRRGAKQRG